MIKGTQAQYACLFFFPECEKLEVICHHSQCHKNSHNTVIMFLFHLSALKLIMWAFSHFTQQILDWLSTTQIVRRLQNVKIRLFFFFFPVLHNELLR